MHRELARSGATSTPTPTSIRVIITGAGRAFSAGGDFAMIEEMMADFETRARVWKEARDLVYNIINCGKPVVSSAMRGPAVGAGLVCGLLADVRSPARTRASSTVIRGSASRRAITRRSSGRCYAASRRRNITCCCATPCRGAEAERIGLSRSPSTTPTRRKGAGNRRPSRRGRAERDPLDQIRAEQLAAARRPELRHFARAGVPRLQRSRRARRSRLPAREAPPELCEGQPVVNS